MTKQLRVRLRDWNNPSLLFQVVHLRPRAPMGSPKNFQRNRAMVVALHKWRVARFPDVRLAAHEAGCHLCRMRIWWRWPNT